MTDPRQPAYDAVFAYIRSQPRDFLPSTVVGRNAMIWRAVHAALDAMGVPAPTEPVVSVHGARDLSPAAAEGLDALVAVAKRQITNEES